MSNCILSFKFASGDLRCGCCRTLQLGYTIQKKGGGAGKGGKKTYVHVRDVEYTEVRSRVGGGGG